MLLKQQFRTLIRVQRRVAFENAYCDGKYHYRVVRCFDGEPCDHEPELHELIRTGAMRYTYRIEKVSR